MKKSFELLPPTMPNFILYKTGNSSRNEGFKPDRNTIPITELSLAEALEYAEMMKSEFIKNYKNKMKDNGKQ